MSTPARSSRSFWILLASIVLASAAGARPAAAQLRGDSAAVALVERMVAAIGGRALWSSARSMFLEYQGHVVAPRAAADTELAWRDLREPRQRIEHHVEGTRRVGVMTPASSWRLLRTGALVTTPELAHRTNLAFWPRDFYTLLRRFAISDPDLYVTFVPPMRVVVNSLTQGEIGWWEIGSDGGMIRWGTIESGVPLEYVYGPMRDFGAVKFPAWGSSLDGRWRFTYVRVELSTSPLADSLLARPAQPSR